MAEQSISLAHGSGGVESNALISGIIANILGEVLADSSEDAGVFEANNKLAISTDSFVISPIIFPGGDIGKLCVCGSSNDVSVRGAKPKFMSLSLILEEGFSIATLRQILESIKCEAQNGGIKILSGDTKVVPKGSADGIYINTTCIGEMQCDYSVKNLSVGDDIIVSAPLGTHGAVIFCARNEIALNSDLQSDCAQLYPLLESVADYEIHSVRDATRGGLSAVLNEWSNATKLNIEISQEALPILAQVKGVCEILGIEAINLANEGACVLAVPKRESAKVLQALQAHPLGKSAAIIGEIVAKSDKPSVVLKNAWNAKRYMEYPQGELLPRIC